LCHLAQSGTYDDAHSLKRFRCPQMTKPGRFLVLDEPPSREVDSAVPLMFSSSHRNVRRTSMTRWHFVREFVTLVLFFGTVYTAALLGHGYGL